jgi:hypothetical protein
LSRLLHIKKSDTSSVDFAGACKVTIDKEKYRFTESLYRAGINNYSLFQKFSNFRWPAWINAVTDTRRGASAFVPLMLVNTAARDTLYFTNFLSDDGLYVDQAGMLSPSYAHWSVEAWVVTGNAVLRPEDDWAKVRHDRDVKNSIITTVWDSALFKLQQTVYGARSAVDEAVVEVECLLKEKKGSLLIIAVRPYDQSRLGGLDSVEFHADTLAVTVNGKKTLCMTARPDFVIAGGGDRCRDIDPRDDGKQFKSASKFGMAALGLGYSLKKGENRVRFRVALDPRGGITAGKFDFAKVREDYVSYAGVRIRNGANAVFPDKLLQNWFYGAKVSLLNFSLKSLRREDGSLDYRAAWHMVFGANRMGYFPESLSYVDHLIKNFSADEKHVGFDDVLGICYVIEAAADYFIHLRDNAFLQGRFDFIRKQAQVLYDYARKLKKPGALNRNSLPHYFIAEEHPHDLVLIAHALGQYSYLARCLGIFGDELKFKKESDRVAAGAARAIFERDDDRPENEFMVGSLLAGFPFRHESYTPEMIGGLLGRVRGVFGDMPLFVKSLGCDLFSTLTAANAMLILKDAAGYDVLDGLLRMRNRTFSLPDYVNPATGRANWGEGASMAVSAMVFATIRNLLYVDHPERLDLFPLPRESWFQPGNEIRIEDAPSRFGLISLRMTTTVNEIQLHFDKLPKFVPPDIMINLPCKTKIKQEDDFILKREDETSFIINGWPSIVRFIRV